MPENERYDGKLSSVYLQFTDYDFSGTDATVLSDESWSEMCVMECEDDLSRETYEIEDTCTGNEKVAIPKSKSRKISGELYLFRVADGSADELMKSLENAADDLNQIVAVMRLTDKRDSSLARGSVGNYYLTKFTEKQSASDLIKLAVEFSPAGLSEFAPPYNRYLSAY